MISRRDLNKFLLLSPLVARAGTAAPVPNAPTLLSPGIPHPPLLPYASSVSPNVSAYKALNVPGLAAGSSYTDPSTGIRVYKVTDATHPASAPAYTVQYSTQGLQIGGPWGPNLDQYTIFFVGSQGWLVDYKLGGTFSNYRTCPGIAGMQAFSRHSPQIQYYSTGSVLHRYNTAINALADTAPFPISWPTNNTNNMWLMVNQNDTYATAVNASGSGVTSANLTSGAITSYTTPNLDELYIGYGTKALVNDDAGGSGANAAYVWDLVANTFTSVGLPFGGMNTLSHAPSMNGYWLLFDTIVGDGHMPIYQVFEDATHANPSTTCGDNAGGAFYYGQWHASGHWTQQAGTGQFVLMSMDGSPGSGWSSYAQYANIFVNVATGIAYTLCYHYSDITSAYYSPDGGGYWAQAHTSLSNDGKVVIWNSNMLTAASGGREDIFLCEVPTN